MAILFRWLTLMVSRRGNMRVPVMKRLLYILIWLVIALVAGAVGSYRFNVNFWVASLIAGFALIANGLIAEWEDRRRDGGS
ncbi:hypothetical protein [Massilia sp. TWR1-2-2]|uniref:hypothetical protein n=1 Tax=Massilia sp. TWR1-2-2 TaxID=2804584 RepID=UPI003CEA52F3